MLIGEKPVMAPPIARHHIFCSCPLAVSLHSHLPAETRRCIKCTVTYVLISYPLHIITPAFSPRAIRLSGQGIFGLL